MTAAAIITCAPECLVLKHGYLRSLPAFLRAEVLRHLWRQAGWPEASMSERRWRRLAALVRDDEIPRTEIGAGVTASTERVFVVLRRSPIARVIAPVPEPADPIALEIPGSASVPWAGGRVAATFDPDEPSDESIDLDRLALPLSVRAPATGDRFAPLGMGGNSMPLADFFRGRGVPGNRRPRIPLVCDRLGIVWVVGLRIADRVKVTGDTRRRLIMKWHQDS